MKKRLESLDVLRHLGEDWYAMLIAVVNVVLSYLLLYYMYKRQLFLKV